MASVSSLDKDLRSMRLDKYTPVRANQNRQWIEEMLGERLANGDLLEALKDGTALCKLVNLAVPGAVRFKESSMPFVQMENISHFLRACQSPPLGLQAHDCFLTVDLYESKDPAQVLQCIEAFSRRAAAVDPSRFPKTIGGRKVMSPQATGGSSGGAFSRPRGLSNTSQSSNNPSGRVSPVKAGGATSPSGASSWARKDDMGNKAPAWNIAQYGWTGGASQGNQGISFGARRQITSAAPHVPSIAEKERRRREKEEEEVRQKQQSDDIERKLRAEREIEEERARAEEERRVAEETLKMKEKEKQDVEAEKMRWEEEERRWHQEEEKRIQEEKEVELRLERGRQRKNASGDNRLQGQFLSQYKADQVRTTESDRIQELERQLAEAKEREARYERERQDRGVADSNSATSSPAPAPLSIRRTAAARELSLEPDFEGDSIQESERSFLQSEWTTHNSKPPSQPPRPLPIPTLASKPSPQPPKPTVNNVPSLPPRTPPRTEVLAPPQPPRPLPNPANYTSQNSTPNRTERFLSSNVPPVAPKPASHTPSEAAFSSSAEVDVENQRRQAAQAKTKAGGWASKSLLEREMERERQRQQEWEESQEVTKKAVEEGKVDREAGSAPGQSWDVHQYGYTGGDNLNKGGGGVYGGRRQLVGPRPLGSKGGP